MSDSRYQLIVATRMWDRALGFLVKRPRSCVLMIAPCASIHTFGMRHFLDVAFIDANGVVVKSYTQVPPNRIVRCLRACSVLERKSVDHMPWLEVGKEIQICLPR